MHPYVPHTHSGKDILLCEVCLMNWLQFRRRCARFTGESGPNENCCALCSNFPSSLIVCSTCNRSFCHECLVSSLTCSEYISMEADSHWSCASCANNISKKVNTKLIMIEPLEALLTKKLYAKRTKTSRKLAEESDAEDQTLVAEKARVSLFRDYVAAHGPGREAVALGGSEDLCFICKDGGELVVCESTSCCGKVYHPYCLGNPSQTNSLICPRHYCSKCKSTAKVVACLYCPSTLCDNCLERSSARSIDSTYEVNHKVDNELPGDLRYITCPSCSDFINKIFNEDQRHDMDLIKFIVTKSSHAVTPDSIQSICSMSERQLLKRNGSNAVLNKRIELDGVLRTKRKYVRKIHALSSESNQSSYLVSGGQLQNCDDVNAIPSTKLDFGGDLRIKRKYVKKIHAIIPESTKSIYSLSERQLLIRNEVDEFPNPKSAIDEPLRIKRKYVKKLRAVNPESIQISSASERNEMRRIELEEASNTKLDFIDTPPAKRKYIKKVHAVQSNHFRSERQQQVELKKRSEMDEEFPTTADTDESVRGKYVKKLRAANFVHDNRFRSEPHQQAEHKKKMKISKVSISELDTVRHRKLYTRRRKSSHVQAKGGAGDLTFAEDLTRLSLFRGYVAAHDPGREAVALGGSEDLCFICKDGGELVVCESTSCCGKVYHPYCLGNPSQTNSLICPRHYCSKCKDTSVVVACLYCPFTLCDNCRGKSSARSIKNTYEINMKFTDKMPGNLRYIVCSSCSESVNKLFTEDQRCGLNLIKFHSSNPSPTITTESIQNVCSMSERQLKKKKDQDEISRKRSLKGSWWTDEHRTTLLRAIAKYPSESSMKGISKLAFNSIVADVEFCDIAWYAYGSFVKEFRILELQGRVLRQS